MIFLCKQNIEIKYGKRSADVPAYGAIKIDISMIRKMVKRIWLIKI